MAEMFLKLDGVAGESTDDKHPGEIELLSYGWGVNQPAPPAQSAHGAGAGRATFRDFSFEMRISKASPELFLACASGRRIRGADLAVRRAGERPLDYLTIRFKDVLITSFDQASDDEAPVERVTFTYTSVELTYTPQDPRGGAGPVAKAGWDLRQNARI